MFLARRFLIAAACVMLIASAAPAQNLKLLPNDTEMIMTINLQQMLKSEVAKSNKALLDIAKAKITEGLDDKDVGKYLKKANFDIFADLSSITFAVPGGRNPDEFFVLIEGKFDADKIEAAAVEAAKGTDGKFKVIKIGSTKAFEITPKDDKTGYIGILNEKTMIMTATKADFAEAASRAASGKSANFKSAVFKSLTETVNNKQSISMVATSSIMLKLADKAPQGNPQAQQVIDALKQLDGVSAAVTIAKNVDFLIGVNTKDADTASKYAGLGNILMGAAKAKVAEAAKNDAKLEPLVDIVNSIRVTSQGPNLLVRGQITFETLSKLLENVPVPKQ